MLVAISGRQRIEARDAVPLAEYHCPHCGAPVVLRRKGASGPKFVHRRRSSCRWSYAESSAHQLAKLRLRDVLAARSLRTEVEWEVPWFDRPLDSSEDLPAYRGDCRADLVVWTPTNRLIAIEVQHSAITIEQLERRAFSYASAGVSQIWLPFLEADLLATADERPGGKDGDRQIARYAAPRWQRWLHGYNFGELWFYDTAKAAMWRGCFSPHYVTITPEDPTREGCSGSDHRSIGFRYPSKRWRELTLWGAYPLEDLRIDLGYRAAAEFGGYRYPAGPMARFVAPVPTVPLHS